MVYYNLFYYTSQLTSIVHTATTPMKHLVLMRRVSHGMFNVDKSVTLNFTLCATNKCRNIMKGLFTF